MNELFITSIEKIERHIYYDITDFPYIEKTKHIYKNRKKIGYLKEYLTFDIETTTIECEEPTAFMYHWQACLSVNQKDKRVCFGRTIEELLIFMSTLRKKLQLSKNKRMVVYVHFLSYEFMFLSSFLNIEELFAKEKNKPLKFYADGFEFRCSYFLSNKSLEKLCESSKLCTHYKRDGESYNYKKMRTPYTKMSRYSLVYCFIDVYGLSECIDTLLLEDTLATIPMTSTGYVRREMRKAMNANPKNRQLFIKIKLDLPLYDLLREIFRGGDVHANRYYADEIINDIHSYDKKSSYPASMMYDYFPIGKFTKVTVDSQEKFDYYLENFCCAFRCEIINIHINAHYPFPYIDVAHCTKHRNIINDNGRVLHAEYIEIALTELDYDIIRKTYNGFETIPRDFYIAKRGKLPDEMRQTIMSFFDKKTELDGVDEYEYMKSKNLLNSCYGMLVSNIIHSEIKFEDNEWKEVKPDEEKRAELLEEYYKNRNSFLSYQWGVWVTAQARHALAEPILRGVGSDSIYQDTDCNKHLGNHEEVFDILNREIIKKCEKNDIRSYSIKDGEKVYLGVWEKEKDIARFKTLGAKKYACEFYDREFKITVAGMSKKKGAKAIGDIENFQITGEPLYDVGRTVSYYNYVPKPYTVNYGDGEFTVGNNIAIVDTTYTLGITDAYWEVIEKSKLSIDNY